MPNPGSEEHEKSGHLSDRLRRKAPQSYFTFTFRLLHKWYVNFNTLGKKPTWNNSRIVSIRISLQLAWLLVPHNFYESLFSVLNSWEGSFKARFPPHFSDYSSSSFTAWTRPDPTCVYTVRVYTSFLVYSYFLGAFAEKVSAAQFVLAV